MPYYIDSDKLVRIDPISGSPLESVLGHECTCWPDGTRVSYRLFHPDGREVTEADPLTCTFTFQRYERVPQSNDDGEGDCG